MDEEAIDSQQASLASTLADPPAESAADAAAADAPIESAVGGAAVGAPVEGVTGAVASGVAAPVHHWGNSCSRV